MNGWKCQDEEEKGDKKNVKCLLIIYYEWYLYVPFSCQ